VFFDPTTASGGAGGQFTFNLSRDAVDTIGDLEVQFTVAGGSLISTITGATLNEDKTQGNATIANGDTDVGITVTSVGTDTGAITLTLTDGEAYDVKAGEGVATITTVPVS
jgi:hypothetical protein